MTVYADTPRWPRHGTLWGHLISDTSVEELHETAANAGIHPRAFDFDHYDWPVGSEAGLAAAGVQFVGAKELTRILHASGLRIPHKARAELKLERTRAALAELGLQPELVLAGAHFEIVDAVEGLSGHSDGIEALGDSAGFKVARDYAGARARIITAESTDSLLESAAGELLAQLDRVARESRGGEFLGQLLVKLRGREQTPRHSR